MLWAQVTILVVYLLTLLVGCYHSETGREALVQVLVVSGLFTLLYLAGTFSLIF